MMKLNRILAVLILGSTAMLHGQPQSSAEAQTPPNKVQALLGAMAANGRQMAAYQWKQKTIVVRNGDALEPTIEQLHIDATGTLQRVVISAPQTKVRGPLRKKKAAEVKESIQDMMRLASRYISSQELKYAITKAEIWEGEGASAGVTRVRSTAIVFAGDEMEMLVSATNYLPTSIEFKTRHDEKPMTISVRYRQIPDGPNMMANMKVSVPAEGLVIDVESFDYMRLAAAIPAASVSRPVASAKTETIAPTQALNRAAPGWPREFVGNGTRLVIYQPQLKMWQKFRTLTADTAISLKQPQGKAMLGVVSWQANTVADLESRTVTVTDIALISARFPSLDPVASAAAEKLVRQAYPTARMTISLDRLLAGLDSSKAGTRLITPNVEPPTIFASSRPAVLLFVDGEPIRVPIEGTQLEFIVNTNWDIFYDKANYYLLNQQSWLSAKELKGPWTAATALPADLAKLPAGPNWDDVRKALPLSASSKAAPTVFFTTKPAELLLFKGEPVYEPIQGISLAYASNSRNDVFMDQTDRTLYVLISGRWFRAASLAGPWGYAGNNLPADFAKIPDVHSRAHVLASIPGTQEANDAVLLAQIPVSAVVNRSEAQKLARVTYAGEPKFQAIEQTSLQYAVNTQEKVIKFGDVYYLLLQGVWFISTTPNGPWKTADSIPAEIYLIPASSPVHNVTYVTVSNPTTTTVEYSYTSGYMGAFVVGVGAGATVVYGTGYYYPPYVYYGPYPYPIYYPYPYTYGVGAVYSTGTGAYGVGQAVYGPYGAAGRAAWYNPSTGTYGRAASVQTPYGGRTAAATYNPWTGTATATRQGSNAYGGQWGSSVAVRGDDWVQTQHATGSQGSAGRFRTSSGASGAAVQSASGNTAYVGKDANNNVYAGNDGNLYKKDSSGNWSKYENGSWSQVDGSAARQQAQQQRASKTGTEQRGLAANQNGTGSQLQQSSGSVPTRESLQQQAQSSGLTRESAQQTLQNRQANAPNFGQGSGTRPSVSSDTWQQLNRDASARQQGAFRERARASGGSGSRPRFGGRR